MLALYDANCQASGDAAAIAEAAPPNLLRPRISPRTHLRVSMPLLAKCQGPRAPCGVAGVPASGKRLNGASGEEGRASENRCPGNGHRCGFGCRAHCGDAGGNESRHRHLFFSGAVEYGGYRKSFNTVILQESCLS